LDPEVMYLFLYAFIFFLARNVVCGTFIFIAQIIVLVGSVAWSRVSELSEHHPWLFKIYFDE
jgi:hypothetical protein